MLATEVVLGKSDIKQKKKQKRKQKIIKCNTIIVIFVRVII